MKIVFFGTREYDHYYFDVLAADPDYGCEIKFLTANLDVDTASLAKGGDAVCAFVNSDCSAPVLEVLAQNGIRLLLMRCAGFNNVDLAAAKRLGITVLRVPGYSPEAVAEHAMALAQAANRRICKAYVKVRNNNFALDGLLGYNLYGSSAGIIGTGRIGAAMARICHGYGMTVLAYDQYKNPSLEGIVRYVSLEELLDVYEDEDGHVFEDFSDEILHNEVVPILLSFPNVVVTSHQAFFTRTALQSIAIVTMENARAFARGEKLVNEVRADA